jgi:hypothetical protein
LWILLSVPTLRTFFLTGVFNCLTGDLTIYKMIQKMRISLTEHVDFMGFATDLSLSSANIVGTTI